MASDELAALIAGWAWRLITARRAAQALHHRLARSQLVAKGPALAAVRVWSQRLGLQRRPDLRLTETTISSFSFGVRKPVIGLPDGLEEQLSAPAIDLVVGHECLYVARGDGWRRPLERSFADVLWFNPFAWRMRRELDLARELACDEAVLDRTTVPGDYARLLRDVAGLASGLDASAPAASMSLSGGGRVLSMRVRRALGHAKRKPGRAVMAGALLLVLAGAPVARAQAVLINPLALPPSVIAPPALPALPRADDGLAAAAPLVAPLVAPSAPALPALSAPPAPRYPAPPTYEARIYVSSDGLVRASFPARVTAISGDVAHGYRIDLLQISNTRSASACASRIDGLFNLRAANGQALSRGEAIGERGKLDHFSVSTQCSGQRDGEGRPIFYAPPAPPPPPAAPAAPAPLAAPIAPAAPAPLAHPSPPAPLAPNLAPLAPPLAPNPIACLHALIRAPFDATITKIASSNELGLYVVIDQIDSPQGFSGASGHGCMVKAAHLSKASVKHGQSIHAGGVIGERANGDGNITAECKSFNADQILGPTTPAPADGPSPSARDDRSEQASAGSASASVEPIRFSR